MVSDDGNEGWAGGGAGNSAVGMAMVAGDDGDANPVLQFVGVRGV